MILCVTLNSCLDKTLTAPSWRPGDLVRGISVRNVVGGKGNNVARALKRLGRTARPMTLLGGPTGDVCRKLLEETDGLEPIVVETKAPTRVILTVATEGTNQQTAFFDPDPEIEADEADALLDRLDQTLAESGVEALTLSGSSPSPATHGLYSEMISLAIGRRVPVFLDTYGPALEAIWGFWPTVIQLNRREAAGRLGKATVTDDDVLGLLREWDRRGVICGVVTRMMTKAKKATSVSVTAPIAARRAAPSDFRKLRRSCTELSMPWTAELPSPGKNCPVYGF